MIKIYFPLAAPYPTQKAYGVTTARTAQAATELKYETTILTPSMSGTDDFSNHYHQILPNWLLNAIQSISMFNESAAFRIQRMSCSILLVKFARKITEESLFWCRDAQFVWAILLFTRFPIIFECHNKVSKLNKFLFKFANRSQRICIGTLTKEQLNFFNLPSFKNTLFILPMAAPQDFFEPQLEIRDQNLVGYIGKGLSSGNDNGLLTLIKHVKYCLLMDSDLKFIFVGIEEEFKALMILELRREQIDYSRVIFTGHIPHDGVLHYLSKINYGIIPYPDSIYNSQRFPIKAVEYSASKVNILANKTTSLQNILSQDKVSYFYLDDPKSLYEAIHKIKSDSELELRQLNSAHAWAKKYTYKSRVQSALEKISGLTGKLDIDRN